MTWKPAPGRTVLAAALVVLAVLCVIDPVYAAEPDGSDGDEPASVSLLVFQDGRPRSGLIVAYGNQQAETGVGGLWRFQVAPTTADLRISDQGRALMRMPLQVQAGEILQVIVSLDQGERPRVSLESSLGERGWAAEISDSQPATNADGESEVVQGAFSGVLVSAETGEPVAGARVFVSGTSVEVRSDEQGRFDVALPVGEYAMSFLHPDYATRTVDEIEVAREAGQPQRFDLPPAGMELAEYVVVEPYIEGSLSSVVDERRSSAAVTDLLAAEQISRAGDSDAASALRRVTGLTLVDGKFIFVRGLGERYSSTLVNGAPLPSPDPTRKVVPLDLFPTSVVQSIAVQKSYSATRPGEFGGGAVELRTRGIPEAFFATLGVSVGGNTEATFRSGLTYDGGERDWTGFDDGARDLPESFSLIETQRLCRRTFVRPECFEADVIEQLGEDFAGVWNIEDTDIGPDVGLDGAIGNRWSTDWFDVGVTASASWSQGWSTTRETRRSFNTNSDGDLNPQSDFDIFRSLRTIDFSGFTTAELAASEDHRLLLTSLMVRQSEDETRRDLGNNPGFGVDTQTLRGLLEWTENELITHQLRGEHILRSLAGLNLTWQATDSVASRTAPNRRTFEFDDENNDGNFQFANRSGSNETTFADLEDDMSSYQLDLDLPLSIGSRVEGSVRAGASQVERDRESLIRRFIYRQGRNLERDVENPEDIFTEDNIGDGLELTESTRDTDAYTAFQTLDSLYLEVDLTFWELLRVTVGGRREDNVQEVVTTVLFQDTEVERALLETDDLLPAYALTWLISDSQQLRLSYGETVNRPDFRELTSAPFTDPRLDIETRGNPDLQPASIEHLDLRWEWYFSPDEYLSVALFQKDFENPIETVVQSGENILLSLQNALAANNAGVEVEGRMNLDDIHRWLTGWHVSGNLTWIESDIEIDTSVDQQATNDNRALQGQSDYVANFQLGYDDSDRGLTATLVTNLVGPRISRVGTVGIPDEVEQAFTSVDLVMKKSFDNGVDLSLKLQNLLDESVEFRFSDEAISREYRRGRDVSLSLEYGF